MKIHKDPKQCVRTINRYPVYEIEDLTIANRQLNSLRTKYINLLLENNFLQNKNKMLINRLKCVELKSNPHSNVTYKRTFKSLKRWKQNTTKIKEVIKK
jgi:regulator of replication initiation timing